MISFRTDVDTVLRTLKTTKKVSVTSLHLLRPNVRVHLSTGDMCVRMVGGVRSNVRAQKLVHFRCELDARNAEDAELCKKQATVVSKELNLLAFNTFLLQLKQRN